MNLYQARILDKDRQLKAVLPGVRWHYNRRINEATAIEVYIPKETIDEVITQDHALYGFFAPSQPFVVQTKPQRVKPNKAQYAEIASYIQIYKGDKLKVSGKIVGRTLGQIVTVEAYTEEILLETNLTPAQYGKVWDNWDLADVARDLLDGWQTIRVKDQSQWQSYMVGSSNIDLTTDPGKVMLAKRSNGRYYESGYITLLFNKNEIIDFKGWDRIRWSADSDGPGGTVQTTIQWSSNGTSFTTPFDGGLPEEVGLFVGGNHDQVWVRINLTTEDTESPDPEDNPRGVTPIVFACELIARTHGDLVVGNIPSVAGETVTGLSANHATALKVLHEACDQVGWEFSVWDGALNVAENMGVDRTKDFVFRTGTNIEIASLGDGDDSLVNILTAQGPGRGINRLEVVLRDEASIQEYGPYPNREPVEFNIETLAELQQKAQEYLDEHSTPQMDFAITVVFEHGQEPDYGLGDTVRVADPDTGIIAETRIVAEAREYGAGGLTVNLELGKPSFTLTEAIGRDGKDGKDGKDGRDGRDGKDGKDGEDFVSPIPADPVWADVPWALSDRLYVYWKKAEYAEAYEVRDNLNWGNPSGMLFRGYAYNHAFLPVAREMILYLRAVNAVGEYSVGYATLNISIPEPPIPDPPLVYEFFRALQIHLNPTSAPAVRGYYVYLTEQIEGGELDPIKILVRRGEPLTHDAPAGTTFKIEVTSFDIIGESLKSQAIYSTTRVLKKMEFPEWLTRPIENMTEHWVLDVDADGNVSGLVSVDDGDEKSHLVFLTDTFRIATPGGGKQVFAFDTEKGKLYVLGDIVAEGLIRATEMQADVAQHLLLAAGVAFLDDAHVLHLRAEKITVGGKHPGLVSTKPKNSHLWHFDHSLLSTQGLGPASGTARLIEGGIFGGATWVQSPLEYDTDVDTDYTVVVYKSKAKLADYADKTLAELAAM